MHCDQATRETLKRHITEFGELLRKENEVGLIIDGPVSRHCSLVLLHRACNVGGADKYLCLTATFRGTFGPDLCVCACVRACVHACVCVSVKLIMHCNVECYFI